MALLPAEPRLPLASELRSAPITATMTTVKRQSFLCELKVMLDTKQQTGATIAATARALNHRPMSCIGKRKISLTEELLADTSPERERRHGTVVNRLDEPKLLPDTIAKASSNAMPDRHHQEQPPTATKTLIAKFVNQNFSQSDNASLHSTLAELPDLQPKPRGNSRPMSQIAVRTHSHSDDLFSDYTLEASRSLLAKYNILSQQVIALQRQVLYLQFKLRKTVNVSSRTRTWRRHAHGNVAAVPAIARTNTFVKDSEVQQPHLVEKHSFSNEPDKLSTIATVSRISSAAPPKLSGPTALRRQIREYKMNRYFYERSQDTHALNGRPIRHIDVPHPPNKTTTQSDRPHFIRKM